MKPLWSGLLLTALSVGGLWAAEPVTWLAGPSTDNPTGKQSPAVQLEWVGPAAVTLGQPTAYTLQIRNTGDTPLDAITARIRLPQSMRLAQTEPKVQAEQNCLMLWEVGALAPGATKHLRLNLTADTAGEARCQAWVTFTSSAAANIRVRAPHLRLTAHVDGPVNYGELVHVHYTLENVGDAPATDVQVDTLATAELQLAPETRYRGPISLAPGAKVRGELLYRADAGGPARVHLGAVSPAARAETDVTTLVRMPQLRIEMTGPTGMYLGRTKPYTLSVCNVGTAVARGTEVRAWLPKGTQVTMAAGTVSAPTGREVAWMLGELQPGQSCIVAFDVQADAVGSHEIAAQTACAGGVSDSTTCVTNVAGLSALRVEVLDTVDPVQVGDETVYEVRVTNTGSAVETDVQLVGQFPTERLGFAGAEGPTGFTVERGTIIADALPVLPPGATVTYRIRAQVLERGPAVFHARISTANVPEGVIKQEATTGYQD
jgi:hypothetical protein